MAMYANIDGTNKLLAQTAAEMTAVGGGWQSQTISYKSNEAVNKSLTIPYENYILTFSYPNAFIGFITKSTMFVSSVGIEGDTSTDKTTVFKLGTMSSSTSISIIRHYYSGSTKKYTYVYLTATGIKFVVEASNQSTYSNKNVVFYYKELK